MGHPAGHGLGKSNACVALTIYTAKLSNLESGEFSATV
jgi:hypothetical protein